MLERPTAVFVLGALVALGASPAAAQQPAPAATPLKTITHIRTTPLCTGLRSAIAPAVGKVLQSDRIIQSSKPLFNQYVQASADQESKPAKDLAVMRLERLIGPLVQNTQRVDQLLSNHYVFPKVARSNDDRKLLQMREQLIAVNEKQKRALDIISGFVATQQLGELEAEGHRYDSALAPNVNQSPPPNPVPTAPANEILNAGVTPTNDITRKYDPRYLNTDSAFSNNPLNMFSNAITTYQHQIAGTEQAAAKSVIQAVPLCGGEVRVQPPVPSPSPSP